MTQGWGGWPGPATGTQYGRAGAQQDAATRPGEAYDMADRVQGRVAARARLAWLVGCVAIQSIVS